MIPKLCVQVIEKKDILHGFCQGYLPYLTPDQQKTRVSLIRRAVKLGKPGVAFPGFIKGVPKVEPTTSPFWV